MVHIFKWMHICNVKLGTHAFGQTHKSILTSNEVIAHIDTSEEYQRKKHAVVFK